MRLNLIRIYGSTGTNGYLVSHGQVICKTIELPWLQNKPNVSCIPEGIYTLKLRYSTRFGVHLHIVDVPNRKLILFHPANDARRELRGCIAPVSQLTGAGMGNRSRMAMRKLLDWVLPILNNDELLTLNIYT